MPLVAAIWRHGRSARALPAGRPDVPGDPTGQAVRRVTKCRSCSACATHYATPSWTCSTPIAAVLITQGLSPGPRSCFYGQPDDELADPGPVRALRPTFPADVVGNVAAARHNMGRPSGAALCAHRSTSASAGDGRDVRLWPPGACGGDHVSRRRSAWRRVDCYRQPEAHAVCDASNLTALDPLRPTKTEFDEYCVSTASGVQAGGHVPPVLCFRASETQRSLWDNDGFRKPLRGNHRAPRLPLKLPLLRALRMTRRHRNPRRGL